METILAIDLGKFKSVACIYKTKDSSYDFTSIKTDKQNIHDLVLKYSPDCVVIEICNIAGWVYDLVTEMNIEIKVANTNDERWRFTMVRNKTDRNDALKLAILTHQNHLPEIDMPKIEVRQKRQFINYRHSLTERITQIKNNIRAIMDSQALAMPDGKKGWSQKSMAVLKEYARDIAEVSNEELWRGMLWQEIINLENATDALDKTEKKLDELNAHDAKVQLLRSIPGVGPRLAETTAAYLDEPQRFKNGKQVGCYVGLTPRQYQSGKMDRQGRITGRGNRLLRSLLVEVSWLALRWNPWVRETYEQIRRGSQTRKKIAIVAVARRLLVRMWAMLRDGTRWRAPEPIAGSV